VVGERSRCGMGVGLALRGRMTGVVRMKDVRPLINMGRLVIFFLLILFVIFSRTSMLRDNPLSGILG